MSPSPNDNPNDSLLVAADADADADADAENGNQQDGAVDNLNNTTLSLLLDDENQNEFEETIRHYTRLRRERQETTLSELQVKVRRLEAALAAECKRRTAAISQLQQQMQEQVIQVEERVAAQVQEHQALNEQRMTILEERMAQLQARWETDVNAVHGETVALADVQRQQMQALEETMASEKVQQAQRQDELMAQLEQVSNLYECKWTVERQERLATVAALNDRLDAQDLVRDEQIKQFEASVKTELQLLQHELASEQEERQAADEEIVSGLNRYIQQVQKSLSYVSGV